MSEKYLDSQDQLRDEACAFSAQQKAFDEAVPSWTHKEAFDSGAHQAMQETRLEIALNLIKQVAQEESDTGRFTDPPGYGLAEAAAELETALRKFRRRHC